jgi:TP901 family phage tail tape measure protein
MANAVVGALRIDLAMNAGQFRRDSKAVQAELSTLGRAISDISAKIDRSSIFFNSGVMAAERFVGASQAILNVASSFEKGMSNVGTLVDRTTENLGAMSEQVLEIGRRTPVALTELTSALYDIRSAGIPAGDAMAMLESSAQLAVAGLGTTREAVDLVTSAINSFGLKGEEASRVYDTIFKTIKAGKTTISQLAQGFGAVAGTVATAGVKIDEYLASVAAMTVTGMPAAQAHTQLRAAIAGMTRESEIGKKVLDTLGAKTFKDLIEQSGGLVGAFQKIVATLQGNDANLIKLLGSVEAYNAVIGLTGKQNQNFTGTLDQMRVGAGALSEAFELQNQTIFAATQRLTNNIQALGIAMGNALAPAIKSVSDFVESITSGFKSLSPEMQELVARLGAFAAVTGPAVIAAGFFANALGSLVPIITGVAALIAGLVASTGPIGLFVIASTSAVVAWNTFKDEIYTIFTSISALISEKIDGIISKLTELANVIGTVFGKISEGDFTGAFEAISGGAVAASHGLGAYNRAVNDLNVSLTESIGPWTTTIALLNQSVPITDLSTEATKRRTDAQRLLNQLFREGKQITEELAAPEEALLARQQKLSTLLMANAISAETYGRAMEKATFVASNAYARLASGIANNLASAFGESKAFAIAAAIINTAESITKTLATYGATPWGIAAAASAAAAGAAQIAAIRNTGKGGGGGGGGGGSDGGGGGSSGPGQIPQTLVVEGLSPGQLIPSQNVRELAQMLIDYQRDGGQVVIR